MSRWRALGVFWKPVFDILEGNFAVILVNAQHIKAVPQKDGRPRLRIDCPGSWSMGSCARALSRHGDPRAAGSDRDSVIRYSAHVSFRARLHYP